MTMVNEIRKCILSQAGVFTFPAIAIKFRDGDLVANEIETLIEEGKVSWLGVGDNTLDRYEVVKQPLKKCRNR